MTATADLSSPSVGASHHMVFIYMAYNEIHCILPTKCRFQPFQGDFLRFVKKNSRNLPILGAHVEALLQSYQVGNMTFIRISNRLATKYRFQPFQGDFLRFVKKNSCNLPILGAHVEELLESYQVGTMTLIRISNRLAMLRK